MDIFCNILIFAGCIGFSIFGAYSLGFKLGEDKGRKDMLNEFVNKKK